MIKKLSFVCTYAIFSMYFLGVTDPQIMEKFANFGVPAVLLIYFIYYSSKIYNQLSAAIIRQGGESNQAIAAVVDRFDRALERHEAMVNNIARSNARLMEEIARSAVHFVIAKKERHSIFLERD